MRPVQPRGNLQVTGTWQNLTAAVSIGELPPTLFRERELRCDQEAAIGCIDSQRCGEQSIRAKLFTTEACMTCVGLCKGWDQVHLATIQPRTTGH